MSGNGREDPLSRLQQLADELETAHTAAGEQVGRRIAVVDEAIRRIGVPLPAYWHRAEWLQHFAESGDDAGDLPDGTPTEHPFAFAWDAAPDGDQVEYALCAVRGSDRKCGLHVSVCTHSGEGQGTQVESLEVVKPNQLPLPIRIRALDVLDAFVQEYEAYVRHDRRAILGGGGEDAGRHRAQYFAGRPRPVPHGEPHTEPFVEAFGGVAGGRRSAGHARWHVPDMAEIARHIRERMPDAEEFARRIREQMPDPEEIARKVRESIPDLAHLREQIQAGLPDPEQLRAEIEEALERLRAARPEDGADDKEHEGSNDR
jgi:hypothetical protein